MPSRIDTAGHTKAFGYPVAELKCSAPRRGGYLVGPGEAKLVVFETPAIRYPARGLVKASDR